MMSARVFRGYTARELDTQYNARAAVSGYEKIFADWRARSAAYRQRSTCKLDVPYGPGEREKLDLFLPDRDHTAVQLFIHGGYWRLMDKSDFSFLAEGLVEGGTLVAVVNYGLCPTVTMDDIVRHLRAACGWLHRNCINFGGNPNEIHVSGHSAGGHLTAMLLATHWPSFSPGLPPDLVKSGVAISGLFELEPMLHLPLNDDLRLDRDSAFRNSPILLSPATDAPLAVVVGGEESEEFHRQSYEFSQRWRERGAQVEYVEIPDLNHFTIIDQMKNPDNSLTTLMLQRLGIEYGDTS
jgi:arylformamidase